MNQKQNFPILTKRLANNNNKNNNEKPDVDQASSRLVKNAKTP